jgi:Domain of unknown function (DUF1848)
MIISASYRTDIPAFYGTWFMNRLAAGHCRVVNPYGGPDYRVALTREAADGFVFWTKNAGPFLDHLPEIRRRGFPFVVQLTITGYPRELEASVPEPARAVAQLHAIAARFGRRAAVWRYDPILLTAATETDWHRASFARLAHELRGATDEVVVSFASFYAKTKANLAVAARRHGFTWREPALEERRALVRALASMAADAGMRLTLCAQPELVVEGTEAARCIDAERLSDVAGGAIAAPRKGNRPGCACAESRDIGAYDSCPHGCVYCYAVRRPAVARERFRRHDPANECLAPAPDRRTQAAVG